MKPKVMSLVSLFIAAFGQVATGSAQEITVLLLDVRNGRAFANETVSMQFHIVEVAELQTLEAKTGADGIAKFHLPQPTPAEVSVSPVNPKLYPCSKLLPVDTSQIIAEGLVSHCSKSTQGCRCKIGKEIKQLKNIPGKLVLLARPMTRWERLAGYIWE